MYEELEPSLEDILFALSSTAPKRMTLRDLGLLDEFGFNDSLPERLRPTIFFHHGLTSEHPVLVEAVGVLLDELRGNLPRVRFSRRDYLDALITICGNLLLAYSIHRNFKVAYSRDPKYYRNIRFYYSHRVSGDQTVKLVDALMAHSFARGTEFKHGSSLRSRHLESMRSRLQLTTKLLKRFPGFTPDWLTERRMSNVVRLKDEEKHLVHYKETPETCRMRENLKFINGVLERVDISLPEGLLPASILSHKSLYRVFNNSSFEQGGRFYGGWWELVGEKVREHILIDGQETVELDYSGFHPRMLYRMNHLEVPEGDLYDIPEVGGSKAMRKVVKRVFLVALNAKNRKASVALGVKELREQGIEMACPSDFIRRTINSLLVKHRPLKPYLFKGQGVILQYEDSKLSERILLRLGQAGIPTLPIHDSFIVQRRHEAALRAAMVEEYQAQFGDVPVIE